MKPAPTLILILSLLTATQAAAFVSSDLFPPTINTPPIHSPDTSSKTPKPGK